MRRYWLLLVLAAHALAYSSLLVKPGTTSVLQVPAVPPFTSLGDYRLEFRIHDWTIPASGYPQFFSWGSYSKVRYLEILMKASGELCAADWVDSTSGGESCANLTGHNDVIVRVQRLGGLPVRDGIPGQFLLEAQDVSGTPISSYCSYTTSPYACAITPGVADWSGATGYVGNPGYPTAFSLAWLKWFSTTVPAGSPFSQESTAADLADWRFENNLTNQGTGGYGVSIGSFNVGPSYTATPSYSPTCVAGVQQVFRAGYPAKLDGSGAYPLDGNAMARYLWQELSGPTQVLWSGQNSANPTISQTVFGSYVFQLTVTDSRGQSNNCTVKHGFVATDSNSIVITGNAATDALLGWMIRYGANPWPWADSRHKAEGDLNSAHLADYYRDFWVGSQGPGTVTVTAGSAIATGSAGTTFTTTFCQGPSNPTVPQQVNGQNVYLLLWYPDNSQEGYGLRETPVASCQSDTQLTMATAWYGDVTDCHSGGCRYSFDDGSVNYGGIWTYNASGPGEGSNYYDTVAGFYSLYYRTGIDDYLTAARNLADRFWKFRMDSGRMCRFGGPYPDQCPAPRIVSTLGMVLRAFDGRPDMWPDLNRFFNYYVQYIPIYIGWGAGDDRERAYITAILSYCALYSTDSAQSSSCKEAISSFITGYWAVTRAPDGSWQGLNSEGNSWTQGTSVSLTNGSTSVIASGTSWSSGEFPTHIVFLPTTAAPATYADQTEGTYYTPTFVDGTHLTLDRPYTGSTGTHGWMLGYGAGVSNSFVGWGAQPFIEGIIGVAFEFASRAIADSDPTNATLAHSYNAGIANWLKTYGASPSTKAMYYIVRTVDCQAPIDPSWTWCVGLSDTASMRMLSAIPVRSVMLAYQYNQDPNLAAFGDLLYNSMFAKPGTCPVSSTLCVPDGEYISDLDDGTGWNMIGTPWANAWQKYFGMVFGFGANADWAAYRVGGPQPRGGRIVRVAVNMQSVAGTAAVRVSTIAPDGAVVNTSCTSSPCAVTIDERQGDHIFRVEYLSATGAVLASSELAMSQGR